MANLLHTFEGGSGIHCLAIAKNGCVITGSRDGSITVWDIPNRKKLRSFPSRHETLLSLAITQDGAVAVSGGLRNLKVWDLESGSLTREIDSMADEVNVLVIEPKGMCLSGHKYGGILLWDIDTGERIGALEAVEIRAFSRIMVDPDEVTAMALTPDGQKLVAGSSKGFLRVWDLHTYTCIHALHCHHLMVVSGIIVLPDARHGLSVSWDGTLSRWPLEREVVSTRLFQGKPAINAIALLPGAEEAVWVTEDGVLFFGDVENGIVREKVGAHDGPINALSIWNDKCLLSASEDGTLKFWNRE